LWRWQILPVEVCGDAARLVVVDCDVVEDAVVTVLESKPANEHGSSLNRQN